MSYEMMVVEVFAKVVAPVLGALAMGLVTLVLGKLNSRYGVQLKEAHLDLVDRWASAAVAYVEEQAAARIKKGVAKWDSDTKLATAAAWLVDKVPEVSEEDAQKFILAVLAKYKGVGATDEKAVTYW